MAMLVAPTIEDHVPGGQKRHTGGDDEELVGGGVDEFVEDALA